MTTLFRKIMYLIIKIFASSSRYSLPPAYVVRREGNSFTLFVSPHLGGYPYPIMLCNITQNAMGQTPGGGYPARSSWGGGYPARSGRGYPAKGGTLLGVPCQGYPAGGTLAGGYLPGGYPSRVPPGQVRMGGTQVGYPPAGYPPGGVPPLPPGQVRMGGYPIRTTEGILTTRRAVGLLRSRRRTFLLVN